MIPHLNQKWYIFHEIVEAEKDFKQGIGHIVAPEIKDRKLNFNCGLICTSMVFEVYSQFSKPSRSHQMRSIKMLNFNSFLIC